MDDAVKMTAMAVATESHDIDIESSSSSNCTPTSFTFLSRLSYSEIAAYIGVRGVVLLVILKVLALVLFAAMFMSSSSSETSIGDVSVVSLVGGRPDNLRELIRSATTRALLARSAVLSAQRLASTSSSNAAATGQVPVPAPVALNTVDTKNDLVYDQFIEVTVFICVCVCLFAVVWSVRALFGETSIYI